VVVLAEAIDPNLSESDDEIGKAGVRGSHLFPGGNGMGAANFVVGVMLISRSFCETEEPQSRLIRPRLGREK
jgi:hypothetical protein